jgi:hypothetical protein
MVYKIKGRKIELLEKDIYGYWVTPTKDEDNGLRFEYTKRASFVNPATSLEWDTSTDGPIDESATVDVPDYLAKALVYYLKGRMAEDSMEIEAREFFMHQFQKMIDTHETNKTHGLSQTMVGSWGVR